MMADAQFEELVNMYYAALYRFAMSLTGVEAEAGDLTQQTFYIWAEKGSQLRDPSKAKAWLFTTLHREFLAKQRKIVRFPHQEISETEKELPAIAPENAQRLDWEQVVAALGELEETFRAPVALFYLEDYSYKEIAAVLEVPAGTVKSRISRGLARLHTALIENVTAAPNMKECHG